jgi:hypothetical protein
VENIIEEVTEQKMQKVLNVENIRGIEIVGDTVEVEYYSHGEIYTDTACIEEFIKLFK